MKNTYFLYIIYSKCVIVTTFGRNHEDDMPENVIEKMSKGFFFL